MTTAHYARVFIHLAPQIPFPKRRFSHIAAGNGEGEGVQRATADFVCFHCPLEPAEKTNIIGKGSRIPPRPIVRAGIFSFFPPNDKKAPLTLANQGLTGIRQRLILPGRVQPSTFSTGELNCCVRDGNRWNLSVIATGNGSYFIASPFSFLPFRKRRVEDPCTLTTAHRMILQTVPISSQFSVSDLLSLDFALLTLRSAILIFSFQALNEAFDRLVSSSYTPYSASTDDLSTW